MLINHSIQEMSTQLFDFVEERLGLGLWVWDYRARHMQWSRGTFKLLQLDYGSVEPSFDILRGMIHPDDAPGIHNVLDVMDRQFSINREFRVVLRDKRIKWFQNYGELSTSPEGHSQMVGFLLDITARKEKELDLLYVNERETLLERSGSACFWSASRDGKRLNIPNWTQWTGQSVADMQNYGFLACVHKDDRDRVEAGMMRSVNEGVPFAEDYRLRMHTGEYIEISGRGTLITNPLHVEPEWTGVVVLRNVSRPAPSNATISGRQIRAARALLGWTAADLAKASGTSISSIRRIEDYDGVTQTRDSTLEKIRRAIEAAGVDFVGGMGEDQGIRLRAAQAAREVARA